jgi:PAS domain S-box-containing protein
MMIFQKFRELMTAPIFPDDVEKTRISGMLNTILWASLVCIILFSIVVPFAYRRPGTILLITVAIFLIIVSNLFLLRRAYVYLTGMIFSLTIWIIITLLAILAGGVQTDAYKAYFMAILISGILVGGRTGILFAVLSILTGLVLIVAEANQLLPPSILASPSPISAWVSMTILFVMTAVWLQIASRSINDALDQARSSNQQLQAHAQELERQKAALHQERDLTREVEKSLRRTTERLTILHQIEQGILAARSAEEIADTSLQQIQRLIPCQRISLAVFDYEAGEAVLFAIVLHNDRPADIGRRIPLSAFSSLETLKQGEHYILEDLLAVEDLTAVERQRLEEEGIRSYVNVPLIVRDKLIGSLNLAATQPNPWQQEHLEIAHEIAGQLAIAVEQTRLLGAAEQRAAALEQEVMERKQIEQALQEQRDFAQQVLGQMGQGLTVTDTEDNFTFVNRAFARILGREPEELIGLNPMALLQDGKSRLRQAVEERRLGKTTTYELRLKHADGHWVDVLVTGVPRWQGDKIMGSIAVITDLTPQKTAEREREQLIAELEARNAELGRFTYTVSHDLKSPLVTVRGFLGFLEKDIEKGDIARIREDIRWIREATERMQLLLDDLLELSRIGRLVNPPQPVPFYVLAEEAVKLAAGHIAERGVQVKIAPNTPEVYVDRARVVEALQNLTDNAVKFMGDQAKPVIDIGVENDDDEPIFFVRDNGIGIEPKYHDKVFGLFDRLDQTVAGTGIGLALVKRIIEVHNGRIWIESDGNKNGTTIYFTLPTTANQQED